jgi:hypothetical protein
VGEIERNVMRDLDGDYYSTIEPKLIVSLK